jgi:6-phosphofructokinase 1/ribokinase
MPFLNVFGHINRDIILRVPHIPKVGSVAVTEREVCCVGSAFNTAMIAAKLDVSVDIYSAAGRSLKECVEILRRNGAGGDGVLLGEDDGPFCYIFYDGNEQVAAIYQGPMDNARWQSFGGAEWTHFCTGSPESCLEVAEKVRGKIALDPGQEVFYKYDRRILKKLMKYADLLFCNKNEYGYILKLVGEPEIRIILTLGREGARLIHRKKEIDIPAKKVDKVVKTVGAGDSFRAGFYRAIMNGKTFEDAVRFANEVASRYVCGDIII